MRRVVVVAVMLVLLPHAALAEVKFVSGTPRIGVPLAPFGSRFGVKAATQQGGIDMFTLETSYQSGRIDACRLDIGVPNKRTMDSKGSFWLEGVQEGTGWKAVQRAFFHPDRPDRLLLWTRVAADGILVAMPTTVCTGGFRVFTDENPYPHVQGLTPRVERVGDTVLIGASRLTYTAWRAFRSSTGILQVRQADRLAGAAVSTDSFAYQFSIVGRPTAIWGTGDVTIVVGYGTSREEALANASGEISNPAKEFDELLAWREAFFAGLPDGRYRDVLQDIAVALHMNLVRTPRGWGSVAAKGVFPMIWPWDSAAAAAGMCGLGWYALGQEVLTTQLSGILPDGRLPRLKADLTPSVRWTQLPIHAWAAWECASRDPDRTRAKQFMAAVFPQLSRQLSWWQRNRLGRDGLFFTINTLETGMDDHIVAADGTDDRRSSLQLSAVDTREYRLPWVNGWLYAAQTHLAAIARTIDDPQAAQYQGEARQLAERMDALLWEESRGGWYVRSYRTADCPDANPLAGCLLTSKESVDTWMPAAFGATLNLERTERVAHWLINPRKFRGVYGIPSVAFDSPYFNRAHAGHYWRGAQWAIIDYLALRAFVNAGRTAEALALQRRVLELVSTIGVFETYTPDGLPGYGALAEPGTAVYLLGLAAGPLSLLAGALLAGTVSR